MRQLISAAMSRLVVELARFYRLSQLRDALSRLGQILYRGSFKYTLITSLATGIGHELPRLGLGGLDTVIAVALPVFVFLLAFGGGLALRFLPTVISLGQMTAAEAADYNLMEDYRKNGMDEHLDVLWRRVFRYEARVHYSEEQIEAERELHDRHMESVRNALEELNKGVLSYLGVEDDMAPEKRQKAMDRLVEALLRARPQCAEVEKTRRAFITSARYAMDRHLPQEVEAAQIGFDMSQWEDWRDGAYFHSSDTHLQQQFSGNPTLQAIKREVGWTDVWNPRRLVRTGWRYVWCKLTARALSIQLGEQLAELNDRYRTGERCHRFKAQMLMWPGGEQGVPWLDDLPQPEPDEGWQIAERLSTLERLVPPNSFLSRLLERMQDAARSESGARSAPREEIVARRRRIVRERFGDTFDEARKLIDRIYRIPFDRATELRMNYDAEYAAGMLNQTPADDLARATDGADEAYLEPAGDEAREELRSFLEWAEESYPGVAGNGEARRALAAAFWVDACDLRTLYRGESSEDWGLEQAVRSVVCRKELYSDRLYALRMHQTLALIQLIGARRYIRQLGYPEAQESSEQGPFES